MADRLIEYADKLAALIHGGHLGEQHGVLVLVDEAGADLPRLRAAAVDARGLPDGAPLVSALLDRAVEHAENPPPPPRRQHPPDTAYVDGSTGMR